MFKDSRIYVAGHTGLLGNALVKSLEEEGYSNLIVRTHAQLDLTNQPAVFEFFKTERPEYVFLAAGKTAGIFANKMFPATYLYANLAIQTNTFEAAQAFEVKHLVFYGSSCIYPKRSPQPMKEEYILTGEIEETSEAYALAKLAGIKSCKAYNNQYKTNRFIALLPNSIYGPFDNYTLESSHVLGGLIRKFSDAKRAGNTTITLWGSGNPRREFIFSKDVADASIFAVKNVDKMENNVYNLGTGIDYSIRELAEMVAEAVGYKGDIEWDTTMLEGVQRKLLDSSRFLSLGWSPKLSSLKEGLQATCTWYSTLREGEATCK